MYNRPCYQAPVSQWKIGKEGNKEEGQEGGRGEREKVSIKGSRESVRVSSFEMIVFLRP